MYGTVGRLQVKPGHLDNLKRFIRPESPAEYQRLLDILAKDPQWHSGEIVYGIQTGENMYV